MKSKILLLCKFIFTFFVIGIVNLNVFAQSNVLQDESISYPVPIPVKIEEIKTNSQKINIGESFDAPNNWVESLDIVLTKSVSKKISFLQVEFIFPNVDKNKSSLMIPVSIGSVPTKDQKTEVFGADGEAIVSLKSKSSVFQEQFSDDTYRRDKVIIRIGRIMYDDGTGWAHGRLTRQDADNPMRWNIVPTD